jgi:hypothetical protein
MHVFGVDCPAYHGFFSHPTSQCRVIREDLNEQVLLRLSLTLIAEVILLAKKPNSDELLNDSIGIDYHMAFGLAESHIE